MFETYEDYLRFRQQPNGWNYADDRDAVVNVNRFCEEFNMINSRRITLPGSGPVSGSYIIGSVAGEQVSFNTNPKVHGNKVDAQAEAERLARANPGKEFLLVRVEGRVKVDGVQWR